MTFPIQDHIKNAIEDANPKVIFSAIRNSDRDPFHVDAGTTITYDEANVNVGGGMDIGTGNFIVPVSGIYSFSFRGLSMWRKTLTNIHVRKNNATQFRIFENSDDTKSHDILSTTWLMNLTQNDVISLYCSSDNYWSSGGFSVNIYHPVLFNGHLLMKQ